MISFPKVDSLAMLPAMAAAILERSCDQREDEEVSHDSVTNEQCDQKRGREVKGEKQKVHLYKWGKNMR